MELKSLPAWEGRCSWWSWGKGWSMTPPPQPIRSPGDLVSPPDELNPQSRWSPWSSSAPSSHLWDRRKRESAGTMPRSCQSSPRSSRYRRTRSPSRSPAGRFWTSWCGPGLLTSGDRGPSSWCSCPVHTYRRKTDTGIWKTRCDLLRLPTLAWARAF